MTENMKKFLQEKEEEKKKARREYLKDFEWAREYVENQEDGEFTVWNNEKAAYAFYNVPDVTDEEWKAICEANADAKASAIVGSQNGVAGMLKAIAIIIYIVGAILGIALGRTIEYGYYGVYSEFSFAAAMVWWGAAFVSGTLFLGFGEIVKLLQNIKDKN